MERSADALLDSLKEDLDYYKTAIQETSTDITSNEISQFPIFIAHSSEVLIGTPILEKSDFNTQWSINASTLEEFIERQVIQEEKKPAFLEIYKDPKKFMCVFLISEKGGNFIFYPY